jgi:hypothetical protein
MKYVDKVLRLKKDIDLKIAQYNEPMKFKKGQEFHIVANVLYMGGYIIPIGLQKPLISWIEDNPNLFMGDTRNF